MAWLPDYGVGMFAMANLTYVGPAQPINQAWDSMLKTGGLQKRQLPASPILTQMRDRIFDLWRSWNVQDLKKIAAMNLLVDTPAAQREAQIQKLKAEVGECSTAGPVMAENWMRGQFNLTCQKGTVGVFFTLAPTKPPGVQHLSFQRIQSNARLSAPTGAPAGVACSE
jgi:serine-type D-Ala-D-Ala carboxypeptidase/endopeptidase